MQVTHYRATDLAQLLEQGAMADSLRLHLECCESCRVLFDLVQFARGEPSDEQAEVLLELLDTRDVSWG